MEQYTVKQQAREFDMEILEWPAREKKWVREPAEIRLLVPKSEKALLTTLIKTEGLPDCSGEIREDGDRVYLHFCDSKNQHLPREGRLRILKNAVVAAVRNITGRVSPNQQALELHSAIKEVTGEEKLTMSECSEVVDRLDLSRVRSRGAAAAR